MLVRTLGSTEPGRRNPEILLEIDLVGAHTVVESGFVWGAQLAQASHAYIVTTLEVP